jgi:molybdopterin/thiamine biosynthesis adenylyltransferase
MIRYEDLYARNAGYISADLQDKIRRTRLLIAGCGLGSIAAELAVRTGFERFILVDGDNVEAHNLNRQAYVAANIGEPKVKALAERLAAINPSAQIESCNFRVDSSNAAALVERADLVIDTIDFLDLPAILALHDAARAKGRTVISAFGAGRGTVACVFTPSSATLRQMCGLPADGSMGKVSYRLVFGRMLDRMREHLPADFTAVTDKVLEIMEDGRSCPAPQLASGAAASGALMIVLAERMLAGLPVTVAPKFILVDFGAISSGPGIGA